MLRKNIGENGGMTRLQLLILVVLTVVIGALTVPPWLEYRKVGTADVDVEMIAVAIKKYHRHTGSYPTRLDALVTNPGVEGWRGKYLDAIPETPWGGRYVLLQDRYKVGIARDHRRVPEKYRIGGVAEISRVYHVDAHLGEKYWWEQQQARSVVPFTDQCQEQARSVVPFADQCWEQQARSVVPFADQCWEQQARSVVPFADQCWEQQARSVVPFAIGEKYWW